MSSLYRDPKSPFWFLRFKTPQGKWRSKSLRPLRHGRPNDTRRALAIRDEHSLEEHSRSPQRDTFQSWVPAYIQSRYQSNRASYVRVRSIWRRLSEYLLSHNIMAPQDLTYVHCVDYMPWRTRKAAHNTALMELTVLAMICTEAIRRGIISRNPAARLGIRSMPVKEKPELTDDMIKAIRKALKTEPDWMSHAFEVALCQGCRLHETTLFRSDVDLDQERLHFRITKGDKPFTVPINPLLKPKLKSLMESSKGCERLFAMPANASRHFHAFFQKLGIPGATFHSTRVTVASRLARAGYPISKAQRLLNHASRLIHQKYQRLEPADTADAFVHLKF